MNTTTSKSANTNTRRRRTSQTNRAAASNKNKNFDKTDLLLYVAALTEFVSRHWLLTATAVVSFIGYLYGFTYAYSDTRLMRQGKLILLTTTLALTAWLVLYFGVLLGRYMELRKAIPGGTFKRRFAWVMRKICSAVGFKNRKEAMLWSIIPSCFAGVVYSILCWYTIWVSVDNLPTGAGWVVFGILCGTMATVMMYLHIMNNKLASKPQRKVHKEAPIPQDDEFIYDESLSKEDDLFEGDKESMLLPLMKRTGEMLLAFLHWLKNALFNFFEEVVDFE